MHRSQAGGQEEKGAADPIKNVPAIENAAGQSVEVRIDRPGANKSSGRPREVTGQPVHQEKYEADKKTNDEGDHLISRQRRSPKPNRAVKGGEPDHRQISADHLA